MNKTYVPTHDSLEHKWYVVDAADQRLGRLATIGRRAVQTIEPNGIAGTSTGTEGTKLCAAPPYNRVHYCRTLLVPLLQTTLVVSHLQVPYSC